MQLFKFGYFPTFVYPTRYYKIFSLKQAKDYISIVLKQKKTLDQTANNQFNKRDAIINKHAIHQQPS